MPCEVLPLPLRSMLLKHRVGMGLFLVDTLDGVEEVRVVAEEVHNTLCST